MFFVSKSKYQELRRMFDISEMNYLRMYNAYTQLLNNWNDLVEKVNAKGGESFLVSEMFSKDDINRLLNLCHPDKHDGKQMAHDMTVKLIKLKGKL